MRSLLVVALALAGCSNDVALGGPNTLVRVDSEPQGSNCANGGLAIHTGLDHDGDGYLDDDEISSTQYVCNGSSPVMCAGGSVVKGPVAVEQPSDFAILQDSECVDGDLLIAGVPGEIPALTVETVTGNIVVVGNPDLTNLDGLGHLREIGGTYLVQGNPALANVHGLSALTRVDQISIIGNDALPDLTGLDSFIDAHTQITISNNGALTSLTGLDNLITNSKQMLIHSNHSLTSLGALNNLRSIVLIEISGNETLPSIQLQSLVQISGRLIINNNVGLTSVTMPALTTVGDFVQCDGNAALTAFTGPELLTVASLLFDNDSSLTTIRVPKLLFATVNITMFTLPKLTTVDLTAMTSIGGTFQVNAVPLLASFNGFAKVNNIGGSFTVLNNSGIHDFTGMGALRIVSGDMTVQGNAILSSFNGLGQLQEIGGALKIIQNPMLPVATSQAFANSVTVRGAVTIN